MKLGNTFNKVGAPSVAMARVAGLCLGVACMAAFAQGTTPIQNAKAPISEIANSLARTYAEQQMQRLGKLGDRDSLIAATLIGLPNAADGAPVQGHEQVMQKLVDTFPEDPLALYTAALICQAQTQPCAKSGYQERLLKVAPDNVIHHLVRPNGGKPSAAQVHLAAAAGKADSHFSALLGIVRKALADQPAVEGAGALAQSKELALILRQNEVDSVPWPKLAPTTETCNVKLAASAAQNPTLHADCLVVGLALFFDEGQSMVARSFGGSIIRRFAPGTQSAIDAAAFRRQYVWMSEAPNPATTAAKEQINEDQVQYGEWEAFQRHAERTGMKREPPVDWKPKDPNLLLLPEERSAKP
ncbi:MAG: hypothetical protein KAY03_01670 [Arenimonas sp.]|nr:hypothetical protein [Arenimonas sp.]